MYGFSGDAAKTYLTAVGEALSTAIEAHNKDPFRPESSIVVPFPPLPIRSNKTNPHPPDTAHGGGHSTGVGNSSNIVVGYGEYSNVFTEISQATDMMGTHLFSVTMEIESLCEKCFMMPITTQECLILVMGLRNSLGEFRSFSDDGISELQRFVTGILEIG